MKIKILEIINKDNIQYFSFNNNIILKKKIYYDKKKFYSYRLWNGLGKHKFKKGNSHGRLDTRIFATSKNMFKVNQILDILDSINQKK